MVQSLFCAREYFNDDFIMAYGDIVYQNAVLKKLVNSSNAVSVVVDSNWRSYWETRFEDPLADAESLDMDEQGFITSIGQKVADIDEIQAQYIGLVRFSGVGVHHLCDAFDEAKSSGLLNHMTGQMLDVNQMYMTDLLQAIAFRNKSLKAVEIDGNWLEIDSIKDLEIAKACVEGGKLNRIRGR
jgi:choline kinase